MADKRISQLIERTDIANNDVLPIVASGATTTNKVTVSTLQDWMQDNLDVGVTSVGITIGSTGTDINVSGSPITTSGNITINIPTASATNRGLLSSANWTTFNNKLSSVGLTMPSAFTVSNSPLTANGTIAVTGAGTVAQYIRGDGSLADFPEAGGNGASVSYYLNGSVSQGTIGGIAYREMNKVPVFGAGTDITISSNGYVASFITDANDPSLLEIPAGNWNFETYLSASSGGGSPTFYIELYKVNSGGTATLIASNSGTPESISLGTNINPYFSALAVPTTSLALTDRLAIRIYVTPAGRTITLHTENGHLCQIITTFTTGLTALNGLTAQVQNFTTGTSGTDFGISSAGATHTFNLPDASASNRGAVTTGTQTIAGIKTFTSTIRADVSVLLAQAGTALPTDLRNISGTGLTSSGSNGFGFNSGNNIYFSGSDKGGGIISFSNTGNRTYTLQNASGTLAFTSDITTALGSYVPYTGASANLDLGQFDLFADTIRVNGSSPTSGSYLGFKHATNVTTGAEGYTSMYTFGTNIIGYKSVSGSTNKDFSFDMSSITSNVSGGRVYTLPDASGTIALTSDLSGYVTLGTTQTITAAKTFSNNVTLGSGSTFYMTAGDIQFVSNAGYGILSANGSRIVSIQNGSVTLTGALNGTSASFTGNVSSGGIFIGRTTNGQAFGVGNGVDTDLGIFVQTNNILFSNSGASSGYAFAIGGTTRFSLASTGAATFSSSVNVGAAINLPNNFSLTGRNAANTLNISLISRNTSDRVVIDADGYGTNIGGGGTVLINPTGGNVGIGTASPVKKLQINVSPLSGEDDGINVNNGTTNFLFTRTGSSYTYRGVAPLSGMIYSENNISLLSDGGNITFHNSGGERMRITSGGSIQYTGDPFIYSNTTSGGTALHAGIRLNSTDKSIRFFTNDTTALDITSDKYIRMAASTGGIQFNGDTAAANALDDYEEGSFTPSSLNTSFSSVTAVFGRYIKIGNQVTINVRWDVTLSSTGMKFVVFNLPFAFVNDNNVQFTGVVCNYNGGLSSSSSNVGTTVRNSSGSTTQQYVEAYYTSTNNNSLLLSMTYFTFF